MILPLGSPEQVAAKNPGASAASIAVVLDAVAAAMRYLDAGAGVDDALVEPPEQLLSWFDPATVNQALGDRAVLRRMLAAFGLLHPDEPVCVPGE